MSDELLYEHLALLGGSSIPLSHSPPWISTQYKDRSNNITYIILPQPLSETRAALNSANIKWSGFFDIAPRWSIFSFGSAPVLRFASRASVVASGVELVRDSGPIDKSSRFLASMSNDGSEFLQVFPDESRLLGREYVVVARIGDRVYGGAALLMNEVGGCLITQFWLEGGLHGRNAIGLGIGKEIVTCILKGVAEATQGEVWIHASLEETEILETALELGWRINRNWWRLEGSKADEAKHMPSGGGFELSDWGVKGMAGWKEEWVKALEKI